MNITNYKQKLQDLDMKLQSFNSNNADSDYNVLNQLFSVVYRSGVLDITHLEKKEQDSYKLELFTTLTKHSGTLAFLVIQILAAHTIMTKNDFPKKDHYFAKKCGIAINHLRASKTFVEGKEVDGGFLLNGTLTWASGYKIFDTLLIGFHDGNFEKEAMASFMSQDGFEIGVADATFVGYGLNTVNISLNNFFVKKEEIVSSNTKGNYTKNKSASKTVHFCIYGLGVAAYEKIKDKEVATASQKKLEQIKTLFIQSNDIVELDQLRVELFHCVQQIITTAMILQGGKSILLSCDLQRLYRELMMFNSNGLNDTLKSFFKQNFLKQI